MALKMMTTGYVSSEIDPQYFDDNMLTEEDFHFEPGDFLEMSVQDGGNLELENFAKELQADLQSEYQTNPNRHSQSLDLVGSLDFGGNLDDLLRNCLNEGNIKIEPPSPYSYRGSSPDNDVSVISIPEEDSNCGINGVISDTPPQTPPGLLGKICDSPPKSSPFNPIVVSVTSVPTLTYIIPPTKKPPVKLRLNIQPKPQSNMETDASVDGKNTYDADDIVQLPNGIFRVKDPALRTPKPPSTTTITMPTKTAPTKSVSGKKEVCRANLFETCTAALKRQERIMKNRESAYLSRKRKKEHVQKLEEELQKITTENSSLREENCRLKLRISDLEKENFTLKSAFTAKGMKKTVCLMVVVFMLTFNFASYGTIFQRNSPRPPKVDIENHRIGRILLWNEENNTKEHNTSKPLIHNSFMKDEDDSTYIVSWDKSYNSSTCQQFINKSESLRLENDLLGWVKRVEKKRNQKESKLKKHMVNMKATIPPLPKLQQLGSRYRNENKDIWAKRKNRNEILIYQTLRKDYEDFFDAIHRRDDSFYFVSFSGDHLLLPAIAHNQTLRPKMSFVMPAMILNDSVGDSDDHISMMQIDCEVLDTKLVHIKESVIPVHLRQKHNSSSKSHTKTDSKYSINRNQRRLPVPSLKLPNQPSEHG